MDVIFKEKAEKVLKDLDKIIAYKILEKVDLYSAGHNVDVKKLVNHQPRYRLRVGDYRVLFDIENNTMIIKAIVHRKDAYR